MCLLGQISPFASTTHRSNPTPTHRLCANRPGLSRVAAGPDKPSPGGYRQQQNWARVGGPDSGRPGPGGIAADRYRPRPGCSGPGRSWAAS